MTAVAEKNNVLELMQEQPIVAYDKFRSELAELEAINEKTIFQYDTVAGFTAAKSYIARLRRSAGAVEKVRKAEKAESLEYGRRVDKQAKEIEGRVRAMIEVHQKPIDEIEAREEARISAIRARIDRIKTMQNADGHTAAQTEKNIKLLGEVRVDESFGEFQVEVTIEIAKAIEAQTIRQDAARLEELEAAAFEAAKSLAAAKLQQERDERIAAEAAERATKEAEERAAAEAARIQQEYETAIRAAEMQATHEREEREKAERQAITDKERAEWNAEQERLASEKREREAVEAEQRRVATEAKRAADEAAAREADIAHKSKINNEVLQAICQADCDIPEDTAKIIVIAIARGEIPHVKISY